MTTLCRDIAGYEGLYAITEDGRVFSYPKYRSNGKWLKLYTNSCGYKSINLLSNRTNKNVHRLVALTFIPNPENKPQVNHIDGNKLNNHVSNLEWCTAQENSLHAHRTGLSSNVNAAKSVSKHVINDIGVCFKSTLQASTYYGLNNGNLVQHIKNRRTKTCGGMVWDYIVNDNLID